MSAYDEKMRFPIRLIVLLAAGTAAFAAEPRAAWMQTARWGVFMHYLAPTPDLPVEEWNRRIDQFDVEGLAKQLEAVHAGYFFITLGQNSGHFLAPNETYEKLVGIEPAKCSRRDLVADLYRVLKPRGIHLLVYLPAGAPDQDKTAMEKLEWRRGPHANLEFQRKWERIIAEWSKRWGDHVEGWWFDGCYWPNTMYRRAAAPNFASFAAAARTGNPASVVAFNRGVVVPVHAESEQEDYTAGEINDAARARADGFWVDGAQWHMLSYLGERWSGGAPRYGDQEAALITTRIVERGGVVTWDVPHNERGLIDEPFVRQLRAIGAAVGRASRADTLRP
jgi:hypothetical protein